MNNNDAFKALLKRKKLTLQQASDITGIPRWTLVNWSRNTEPQRIPDSTWFYVLMALDAE